MCFEKRNAAFRTFQSCPCSCSEGKDTFHPGGGLQQSEGGRQWYLGEEERGASQEGGRQGAPPLTIPRAEGGGAGLSGRPGQEAEGGSGSIHASPPLKNACYRLTKQTRVCTRLSLLSASSEARSPGPGFHLNYGETGGRARPAPKWGEMINRCGRTKGQDVLERSVVPRACLQKPVSLGDEEGSEATTKRNRWQRG